MRSIPLLQPLISTARVFFVVTGMLCVVTLMGATARSERVHAATPIQPNLHGLLAQPQHEDPTLHQANELLHDLPDTSDSAVGQSKPEVRQVVMEVTAYCACSKCCGPNASGITASGRDISYNNSLFVAADPSLPFGTKVLIPGYSDAPVEVIDRGSAIRGEKIDVFFSSHDDALEWGRRTLQVTILD